MCSTERSPFATRGAAGERVRASLHTGRRERPRPRPAAALPPRWRGRSLRRPLGGEGRPGARGVESAAGVQGQRARRQRGRRMRATHMRPSCESSRGQRRGVSDWRFGARSSGMALRHSLKGCSAKISASGTNFCPSSELGAPMVILRMTALSQRVAETLQGKIARRRGRLGGLLTSSGFLELCQQVLDELLKIATQAKRMACRTISETRRRHWRKARARFMSGHRSRTEMAAGMTFVYASEMRARHSQTSTFTLVLSFKIEAPPRDDHTSAQAQYRIQGKGIDK